MSDFPDWCVESLTTGMLYGPYESYDAAVKAHPELSLPGSEVRARRCRGRDSMNAAKFVEFGRNRSHINLGAVSMFVVRERGDAWVIEAWMVGDNESPVTSCRYDSERAARDALDALLSHCPADA